MNTIIDIICYKYKHLKNGNIPLKLRITKDRKRKYVDLGISVKEEHWDFVKNKPKPNCPNRKFIEKVISDKLNEYRTKALELQAQNKPFTASSLVDMMTGKKTKITTVKELFERYIADLTQQRRHGYSASVRQLYNSLIKFNGNLDIYFNDIDLSWLKSYESWLREQGKAENTIGIRFRTLRAIYNLAIEEDIAKAEDYPFKKYKVSKLHETTAKRALKKKEILAVINYPHKDKSYYISLAINIFTFSYLIGGINFVDIAYLTDENIMGDKLVYKRRKTGRVISLPLNERAVSIIRSSRREGNIYLFPILNSTHITDQQRINRVHKVISKVNRALKQIGEELNLPITLTTYVARHSFATVLKKSGIPTAIISESLGHSSEKVTRIYLDTFENHQINDALSRLL